MCLLCYISPGAPVNWEGLENACDNNPDGFGWSIHHGDRIQMGRHMDATDALNSFAKARAAAPNTHAMFHARWATHGAEDLTNVHPFVVDTGEEYREGRTVLAHNGILPVSIPKGDTRSDTRFFAEEMVKLRANRLWDRSDKVSKLEKWMGGSKFVIFTTEPQYSRDFYIVNEHLGHWDEGTWWSNDSYEFSWKNWRSRYNDKVGWGNITGKAKASDDDALADDPDAEFWMTCEVCQSVLSDVEIEVYGVCSCCNCCLDCGEGPADCLCYNPQNPAKMNQHMSGDAWDDYDYPIMGQGAAHDREVERLALAAAAHMAQMKVDEHPIKAAEFDTYEEYQDALREWDYAQMFDRLERTDALMLTSTPSTLHLNMIGD